MPENRRLGELLFTNKLITIKQLESALEMQLLSPSIPIGQILCQIGYLERNDLEYILDRNGKRLKLGEILVSMNLISEERLHDALRLSRETNIPLGRAMISLHLLEEEQIARAIALQHDLEFVNLTGINFDPKLSTFMTVTFAQRLRIVPIRCRDTRLTIAMANPIERNELAQLESWCKMSIAPVIAKESDIVIAQQKIFKFCGVPLKAKTDYEVTEDQERIFSKSKYVSEYISDDIDSLTKRIIATGIREGTSDIHFESTENGMNIRYRLDGILQTVDLGADNQMIRLNARQIVSKIKILCDMDIAEHRRPQDSSFRMKISKDETSRTVDFRVSTVPTQYGENVVIRILDKRCGVITLEGLHYSPEVVTALYKSLEKPTGIFLVVGPTGSGKTSTLYAVLSHINSSGTKTLTIEDPIEYSIDGITQTEVNEIIGNSFARLLRSFLRQDPDNIMVGEIRDLETATISMRAALTGHTVLSTLHTNDSTSAVTRLVDMGIETSLLSSTLRCVLAQRLVRRICSECKVPYSPSEALLIEFGIPIEPPLELFHGKGCAACHFTGFSGRLPIVELWIPTREELLLINRRPDNITLRNEVFIKSGRPTMIDDGFQRVLSGETTLEELLRTVPYEQIESGMNRIKSLLEAFWKNKPPLEQLIPLNELPLAANQIIYELNS